MMKEQLAKIEREALEAITGAEDPAALLLPVDRLFASWAEVTLTKEQERRFCNGAPLWSCRPEAENCRVYGEDGLFLGLGTYDGEALRSRKLFLS